MIVRSAVVSLLEYDKKEKSEGYDKLHLKFFLTENSVGSVLRHNQGLALVSNKFLAAHREFSRALKHGHHGVSAGSVGGNFLSLVK